MNEKQFNTMADLMSTKLVSIHLNKSGPTQIYVDAGEWLKEHTNVNASIATVEIGTVGWYSERNIVDILGLVNKYNADFIGERKLEHWVTKYQPDYILAHNPIWGHEVAVKKLIELEYYIPVKTFNIKRLSLFTKNPEHSDKEISNLPNIDINHKISNVIGTTSLLDTNELKPLEDSEFMVTGLDPYLVYLSEFNSEFQPTTRDKLVVKFHLNCQDIDRDIPMQLFWRSKAVGFNEHQSLRFNAKNGSNVVPINDVKTIEDIFSFRLDLDGSVICNKFKINEVQIGSAQLKLNQNPTN